MDPAAQDFAKDFDRATASLQSNAATGYDERARKPFELHNQFPYPQQPDQTAARDFSHSVA